MAILFNRYANRENSFFVLVSNVRMCSSKISPSSSPLLLTSPFQHSAALSSSLLWPSLVTAHLCHGAAQTRWRPKVQTNLRQIVGMCSTDTHFPLKLASVIKAGGRVTVRTSRHRILQIGKCVWQPPGAVSLTDTHEVC